MRWTDYALFAALPVLVSARVELDPETHRELLLSGRPQIGLWKALLKQAETEVASSGLL
jgi:hypothetical protein